MKYFSHEYENTKLGLHIMRESTYCRWRGSNGN